MAGLNISGRWAPKFGAPTAPTNPTNTIGTAPAGGTPTGGVNPGGFSNTGPGGTSTRYGQAPGTSPVPGVDPTGKTYSVDPTGMMTPFTPSANPWGGTDWKAGDGTDLFQLGQDRFLAMLRGLKGEGGLGGPVGMPREPGLTIAPPLTKTTMADREPAEIAAFARAKDRLGKIASGSTMALKDAATSTGRSGSGMEGADMRSITEGLQSALGDVVRDQTTERLKRADDVDDRNMGIDLNTRGQDIGQAATEYGGNIQQRGQDFQGAMNDPTRQMIMSMLPQFMSAMNFMPRY
jgi:hypothetical protein